MARTAGPRHHPHTGSLVPIIRAERLAKWYGSSPALADISFGISAGEVVGLLGPNGSGKSTLLRILTGYLAPSSGTAWVDGLDLVEDPLAVRQCVGYLPEDAPLYEWMRVVELLGFMARVKGLDRASAHRAVEEAAGELQLGAVMDRPIGRLSRGYRQRVAIAQALLGNPPVLVLDEPTNALDAHQVIAVRELIRGLAGRRTVLVASHVLTEIERMATRVMILLDGKLLTQDAAAESRAVQRFRLRIAGPMGTVLTCLRRVPSVREVRVEAVAADASPRSYQVEATRRRGQAEELAAAVAREGLGLSELTQSGPDLERVFLDLTRQHVAGEAA